MLKPLFKTHFRMLLLLVVFLSICFIGGYVGGRRAAAQEGTCTPSAALVTAVN